MGGVSFPPVASNARRCRRPVLVWPWQRSEFKWSLELITKLVHTYTFCTMRCTGDSCCASDFLGRRKAQLLVAEIENCVVCAVAQQRHY